MCLGGYPLVLELFKGSRPNLVQVSSFLSFEAWTCETVRYMVDCTDHPGPQGKRHSLRVT